MSTKNKLSMPSGLCAFGLHSTGGKSLGGLRPAAILVPQPLGTLCNLPRIPQVGRPPFNANTQCCASPENSPHSRYAQPHPANHKNGNLGLSNRTSSFRRQTVDSF